ncbi:MAG: T9SS type A sorting domain-containing protein, partial [Ignavibacteria bacterium]|nr:T9SS type A sorting domain-containing protein [Ignavibacteria bacterium]
LQYLTLKEGCNAIDAGIALNNINENFTGEAPDLGAFEFGIDVPEYGPRENNTVNVSTQKTVTKDFSLSQNYPNPFNPSTTIKFSIPKNGVETTRRVVLKILDVLGREVITLVNEHKPAGNYTVEWNGTNSAGVQVGSGIYFYQLKTSNGFLETRKMLLIK